jgi:hypothetical protein
MPDQTLSEDSVPRRAPVDSEAWLRWAARCADGWPAMALETLQDLTQQGAQDHVARDDR